jgi:hypothetical protein
MSAIHTGLSPDADGSAVPERYRGVWTRTLLETPGQRDERSFVRWLQTSVWHADLRIPLTARPGARQPPCAESDLQQTIRLASQQGFCGVTQVQQQAEGEVCTWHRLSDFQPARQDADAGVMVFEAPDRVIEMGIHAPYLEIWERLPDSTGRYIVLAGLDGSGKDSRERVLVAGRYLMHVRPRCLSWPHDREAGQSLADLVARHPAIAREMLDFEISFGTLNAGRWTIEHSTLPELEGRSLSCVLHRELESRAHITGDFSRGTWRIMEWSCTASSA